MKMRKAELEDLLHKEGIQSIRLDAFSLNPYALKMYERLGYQKVGQTKAFCDRKDIKLIDIICVKEMIKWSGYRVLIAQLIILKNIYLKS